ncbi:MAG: Alpha/beta hydrolase [Caulobacteraceae bacterium]|nr:Alpha/beta hydrolase [Caulobacteraceae bacterium]
MALPQLARYPSLGPSLWSFDRLPDGIGVEPIALTAADGGESSGVLYRKGGERVCALFMHPRGDMQRHYAMPTLLQAGIATWGQAGRFVNNDINCIKERLLLDVAAAMTRLKSLGFEKLILVGNSGGGALYTFYQSQAVTQPPARHRDTAAGDACDLNGFDLPAADGMVQLATHLGEGKLMEVIIDPSVTDENDPLSIEPSLDMYEPANGFAPLPGPSRYKPEFVQRYRQAQRERIARIDAIARALIEEQRHYLRRIGAEDFEAMPFAEQQWALRRGFVGRYMEVHRTEANPAYTDPSITPSARAIGSFFTPRPDVLNYSEAGFGKYQTPRAWLSTWSGKSSRASTLDCVKAIKEPTLVIAYTGDNAVMPCDTDAIHRASPADDKTIHKVAGDHLGYGPGGMADRAGQRRAAALIAEWIGARF